MTSKSLEANRKACLKRYLRHKTTEKRDWVDSYQPYLPVAWVKQTRCSGRRCGRWADYVCWWSQHFHQTLEAFNFRQRFGNFSFVVFFIKVFFPLIMVCSSKSFHKKTSPWLFFASVFTSFSHDFLGRYANSCVIFFRAIRCYTSASFSLFFFIQHKIAGVKRFFFLIKALTKPSKQTANKNCKFSFIFFTVFDLQKKNVSRNKRFRFGNRFSFFFNFFRFILHKINCKSKRKKTKKKKKVSLDVHARVHFLAQCATSFWPVWTFLSGWLAVSEARVTP